jgi:rhamnulokinase
MNATAYLGIDLGAESGRAIIGVLDADRLRCIEVHRFENRQVQRDNGLRWDFEHLWENILDSIRLGLSGAFKEGLTLRSVGIDTWGVDCGYIDADGQLVEEPFCYRDPRNVVAYDKMLEALGKRRIYDATGIQFMPINTICQVLAQQEADPTVLERAERMLFIPDILHMRLTGEKPAEATIASTSQMIDPRTGKWASDLISELGIPDHLLGPIIPPATNIGKLLPEIVAQIGPGSEDLDVIVPATHDTAAAIAATPAEPDTRWCYMSSGTWSLMGAEITEPCTTDAAMNVPFTNEGGVDGTIRFLKNIAGLWLVQQCRRDLEASGQDIGYIELEDLSAAAEPFRTLIDTDHAPFGLAGDMFAKMRQYAKQTHQPEPTSPGEYGRTCVESLALTYRRVFKSLCNVLETDYEVLHILGGGGKHKLLNQMTADAINRTVVAGPDEATTIGNLLTQAMGAGDVRDLAHIRSIVRDSFEPVTYTPGSTTEWDVAAQRFEDILHGATA